MSKWPYNTAAWQKLRRAKLSDQPLCEVCLRREVVTIANTVDHIVAIEKGGDPFPPLDQLMSMCAACHNSKTARMDRGNSKGGSRFKGCDVDGNPLDDADDWHTAPQGSPPARETQDAVPTPAKAQTRASGHVWANAGMLLSRGPSQDGKPPPPDRRGTRE